MGKNEVYDFRIESYLLYNREALALCCENHLGQYF